MSSGRCDATACLVPRRSSRRAGRGRDRAPDRRAVRDPYNDGSLWGPAGAWRLGSIGVVQLPNGRRHAIAIYDDDPATMTAGVGAVET